MRPGGDGTPFMMAKRSESDDKRVGVADGNGAKKKELKLNLNSFSDMKNYFLMAKSMTSHMDLT